MFEIKKRSMKNIFEREKSAISVGTWEVGFFSFVENKGRNSIKHIPN